MPKPERLISLSQVVAVAVAVTACDSWPWHRADRTTSSGSLPPSVLADPTPLPPAGGKPVQLTDADDPPPLERVIERGTGSFVRPLPPRSLASMTRSLGGDVTLNVVDADLREVIRLVLEDALGVNYVVDPSITGTVTVQTSEPVPADDLVAMLDSILRVNGAALVQTDSLFKVVPIDRALSSGVAVAIQPVAAASEGGFTINVVPVHYVAAAELAVLLEPFAPPGGSVQAEPQRNLLILGGSSDQLATLIDLVGMFDVDWLAGMSFGLFPLESADATALVLELDQVFGGLEAGPLTGVVRFLPIERLNAVLAMSAQPAYLDRAQVWIERLDRAAEGDQERVYVYAVQNGRAADLAGVLGELFDAEASTVSPSGLLAPGMEAAEIRSSGFDIGGQDGNPDDPSQSGQRQARRASSGPGGTGAFGGGSSPLSTPTSREPTIRIIADETTNSLVVRATAKDYRRIEKALDELDVVPLQVLIEATIAEVLLNDSLKYGVEWFFSFGDVRINLSSRDSGVVGPTFPGFSTFFANSDVRAVITALEEVTDINVISSPHILVLDNQTARLQVGDEVPIATQSSTSVTDPDAPVVNSIEQRDTGVILSVTPRVNASGLVIMEIEEETSDAERTTTSTIDSPTIRQRRISSTVAVQSGETVVLGGLIRDDLQQGRSGVPFLSGLPLIGPLFGTHDNSATRNELLVLITPRVVRGTMDARAVTAELRRRLSGLFPLEEKVR